MSTPVGVFVATRGGVITMPELRHIAATALAQGTGHVHVTHAQELLLPGLDAFHLPMLCTSLDPDRVYLTRAKRAPLLSSAPFDAFRLTTSWLSEGVYLSLLATLPRLSFSLALVDVTLETTPRYLAQVNLLVSTQRDIWHIVLAPLHLQEGPTTLGAIRTSDLHDALLALEKLSVAQELPFTFDAAAGLLESIDTWLTGAPQLDLARSQTSLRSRDGICIPSGTNGISAAFLEEVALLPAQQQGITIRLLPANALVVHCSEDALEQRVRLLMAKHRVGESRGQWNERIIDLTDDPTLRHLFATTLDTALPVDIGLCAAIIREGQPLPDADIYLVRHHRRRFSRQRFTLHLRKLNAAPHTIEFAAQALASMDLSFVNDYFVIHTDAQEAATSSTPHPQQRVEQHECSECLNVYAERYGDPVCGVPSGTPFDRLPREWRCPVCAADKDAYRATAA